jgi:hypothetical protein
MSRSPFQSLSFKCDSCLKWGSANPDYVQMHPVRMDPRFLNFSTHWDRASTSNGIRLLNNQTHTVHINQAHTHRHTLSVDTVSFNCWVDCCCAFWLKNCTVCSSHFPYLFSGVSLTGPKHIKHCFFKGKPVRILFFILGGLQDRTPYLESIWEWWSNLQIIHR